ncbi:MAG: hypothetical protein IPJ37_09210 [Bacteroidales bacterium]|nr:hypothetical protein [Bacteroidales bacterium]
MISIRADEGKNLKEIEAGVDEAFDRFEKEGITEKDIERVKASKEKEFCEESPMYSVNHSSLPSITHFLMTRGILRRILRT